MSSLYKCYQSKSDIELFSVESIWVGGGDSPDGFELIDGESTFFEEENSYFASNGCTVDRV
jgi:hypothetical protein